MVSEPGPEIFPQWWVPLIKLLIHVLVGFVVFFVIGSAAVILDLIIQYLKGSIESSIIIKGLYITKGTIFVIDVLLFLIYIINISWQFARSLSWRD